MSHHLTHPNLTEFVRRMNAWAKLSRDPEAVIDLVNFTEKMRTMVRNRLEGELSPENLTCDGELRGKALKDRCDYLAAVGRELETL